MPRETILSHQYKENGNVWTREMKLLPILPPNGSAGYPSVKSFNKIPKHATI